MIKYAFTFRKHVSDYKYLKPVVASSWEISRLVVNKKKLNEGLCAYIETMCVWTCYNLNKCVCLCDESGYVL